MGPLCEAGADPSANMKNNFSPLDFAAEFNHLETVELLCSYGASNRAEAALQASRAGHSSLARWLEASEDWTTPLHHLGTLSPERAYRLLREGADLHAAIAPGRPSPLTIACEGTRGRPSCESVPDTCPAADETRLRLWHPQCDATRVGRSTMV